MKKYVKPELTGYEMSPVRIMEGSVVVKGKKIGVSSFFTDEDDWTTETSNGTTKKAYSFWD